jgi:hypothetical protein
MEDLFGAIFDAIYNFFVPDRKLTMVIGQLLASGQYDQCATYIKAVDKKKLKRAEWTKRLDRILKKYLPKDAPEDWTKAMP